MDDRSVVLDADDRRRTHALLLEACAHFDGERAERLLGQLALRGGEGGSSETAEDLEEKGIPQKRRSGSSQWSAKPRAVAAAKEAAGNAAADVQRTAEEGKADASSTETSRGDASTEPRRDADHASAEAPDAKQRDGVNERRRARMMKRRAKRREQYLEKLQSLVSAAPDGAKLIAGEVMTEEALTISRANEAREKLSDSADATLSRRENWIAKVRRRLRRYPSSVPRPCRAGWRCIGGVRPRPVFISFNCT